MIKLYDVVCLKYKTCMALLTEALIPKITWMLNRRRENESIRSLSFSLSLFFDFASTNSFKSTTLSRIFYPTLPFFHFFLNYNHTFLSL